MNDLARRASALLGGEAEAVTPLTGGDLSSVVRIRLTSGLSAVAKTGPNAPLEAEMLRAIRTAGVPAPEVLAVSDTLLLLEDLGDGDGLGRAWGALGQAVSTLHAQTGSQYGWHVEYGFGPVAIANRATETWPEFWAERRLLPGIEHLPSDLARRVETLCGVLSDRLPRHPRPALLHGDLWSGNVICREDRIIGLIDPACFYGHAEVDLAMLCLFGRPGEAFWAGYGRVEPGLEDRRPIYQLWPAIVHLRLFGAGYRGLVSELLERCGT